MKKFSRTDLNREVYGAKCTLTAVEVREYDGTLGTSYEYSEYVDVSELQTLGIWLTYGKGDATSLEISVEPSIDAETSSAILYVPAPASGVAAAQDFDSQVTNADLANATSELYFSVDVRDIPYARVGFKRTGGSDAKVRARLTGGF